MLEALGEFRWFWAVEFTSIADSAILMILVVLDSCGCYAVCGFCVLQVLGFGCYRLHEANFDGVRACQSDPELNSPKP